MGQFDEALHSFAEAVKQTQGRQQGHGTLISATFNIGNVLAMEEKYDDAIEYYTQALRVSGPNAQIFNNRGAVYHAQLKFSQAQADYDAALKYDPDYELTLINRVQLHIQRNDAFSASRDLSAITSRSKIEVASTMKHKDRQERKSPRSTISSLSHKTSCLNGNVTLSTWPFTNLLSFLYYSIGSCQAAGYLL